MGEYGDRIRGGAQQVAAQAIRGAMSLARSAFQGAKAGVAKSMSIIASHKIIASTIAVAVGAVGYTGINTAVRDDLVCRKSVASIAQSLDKMPKELDANEEEKARIIYAALNAWGMDNLHIAGVVGNFAFESGIEPYRVEGIGLKDPHRDEKIEVAMKDPDAYVNRTFSTSKHGGYMAADGKKYMGIGVAQWTAGRHIGLVDMAKEKNQLWYSLDLQLAYMISRDSDVPTLERYRDKTGMTPEEAAVVFLKTWERADDSVANSLGRQKAAAEWFVYFNDMNLSADEKKRGQTILDEAQQQRRESTITTAKKLAQSSGCEQQCEAPKVSGKWVNPVSGTVNSSSYGMRFHPIEGRWKMHDGVDIAAPEGTPIYAANSGTVVKVGVEARAKSAGNIVLIDHGENIFTGYFHQVDGGIVVKEGDRVSSGQLIGHVGTTGGSTGPHLHFEVRENATESTYWGSPSTNPVTYMAKQGVEDLGKGASGEDSGKGVVGVRVSDILCPNTLGDERAQIVEYAKRFLGNPYSQTNPQTVVVDEYEWRKDSYTDYTPNGAKTDKGMDCSGYAQHVFRHFGYDIGRTTGVQAAKLAAAGREISEDQIEPGDIIIWDANDNVGAAHVAIYIGDNKFYHASGRSYHSVVEGKTVYDTIEGEDWKNHKPGVPYQIFQVVGSEKMNEPI